MKLPSSIRQAFTKECQKKAEDLADTVFLEVAGDDCIEASCSDYFVDLSVKNGWLYTDCDCPDFTKSRPCPHILATVIKSRELKKLTEISKRNFKGFHGFIAQNKPSKTPVNESIQDLIKKIDNQSFRQTKSSLEQKKLADKQSSEVNLANSFVECSKHQPASGPPPLITFSLNPANRQQIVLFCCWQSGESFLPYSLDKPSTSLEITLRSLLYSLPKSDSPSTFLVTTKVQLSILSELQKIVTIMHRDEFGQFSKMKTLDHGYHFQAIVSQDYENNFTVSFGLKKDQEETCVPIWKNSLCSLIDPTILAVTPVIKGEMLALLRRDRIVYPYFESNQLLLDLHENGCDMSSLPDSLICREQESEVPKIRLHIRTAKFKFQGREQLHADPFFVYQGAEIHADCDDETILNTATKSFMQRHKEFEKKALKQLPELEFRYNKNTRQEEVGWKISPTKLDEAVQSLLEKEWTVTAHGKTQHAPGDKELIIESKTDWFEIKGSMTFNGEKISLPDILKAVQRGEKHVLLGDGSFGVLPEDWLKFYTVLSEIGTNNDGQVLLRPSQTLVIKELLKFRGRTQSFDKDFQNTIDHFNELKNIAPVEEKASFKGQLRPYQREGLAWLLSLRKAGFGGCLADDMGLGKTIQVLAFLQYALAKAKAPALIVLPRSLMFNWQQESAKFTPEFKVHLHTGPQRRKDCSNFSDYDIVLTTYGTLLRDIPIMSKMNFEVCILDEAQAIKNASSSISGAVRLLKAHQRIAMSGTPIENHIGELGSLFDFLNPGMLGRGNLAASLKSLPKSTFPMLAQAFQPLVLRRHKSDLLTELPAKVEQVLYCEMDSTQQKTYDELKQFYQTQMLKKDEGKGERLTDALTALLRLRQAACHPAVIDPEYTHKSVKMEMLVSKIMELREEGRKCLVFSQFTKLLDLAETRLQEEGCAYVRLDGSTADRAAVVNEFQDNDNISTFLISLKAGGTGLNLTQADTVFMLDPWWNPAAESQAIDRAWRMGQKNTVFAYRLITRGTVEEKVLDLQAGKREIADAILAGETKEANADMSFAELKNLLG